MKACTVAIAFLIVISDSKAEDACIPNAVEFNICEKAKEIASDLQKSLPIVMSRNLSIVGVAAIKTAVVVQAKHALAKSEIERAYAEEGMALQGTMKIATKGIVCGEANPTRAFVNLGGEITYVYVFSDLQSLQINIKSCE